MTNAHSERETNLSLIRTPLGEPWSGRARYAAAMYFYGTGEMNATTLEIYRICSRLDDEDPIAIIRKLGIGGGWAERMETPRDPDL